MGWRDREYNRGGGFGPSDYLGNPIGLISMSIPFGTWFGARTRLSFWLLLSFLLTMIQAMWLKNPAGGLVCCLLVLMSVLIHELGHKLTASRVGGSHNEFVLWPAGGMVPPQAPPFAWPFFVTHAGGIGANLLIVLVSGGAIAAMTQRLDVFPLNPLTYLLAAFGGRGAIPDVVGTPPQVILSCLYSLMAINVSIVGINLFPYYWFDGGPLLQSAIWPFAGRTKAMNITCIVGMVVAVPMFLLMLMTLSILGMLMWALLFASSYTLRKQVKAGAMSEADDAIAWSAGYSGETRHVRRKIKKGWFRSAKKKAEREAAEQARIDAILAKVSERGLHSLTYWEKRALKRATERQRQRDLAERV